MQKQFWECLAWVEEKDKNIKTHKMIRKKKYLVLYFLLGFKCFYSQTIWYIKANGTGDGTSWNNASSDLQSIMTNASSGDEVWVSSGIYKPTSIPPLLTTNPTQRNYTFYIKDVLKLYGGFVGTETNIDQRNIDANSTILSGDFNNDDIITGAGNSLMMLNNNDNSYKVVAVSIPLGGGVGIVLDGFVITGGNSVGNGTFGTINANPYPSQEGSGLSITGGTNQLRNNKFYGNYSEKGGAVYLTRTSTVFENNTLNQNVAYYWGGGLCILDSDNVTIIDNVFKNNKAILGGGIYIENSTAINIDKNFIIGNYASSFGGGIKTQNSQINLYNSVLSDNSARIYGGAMNDEDSALNIINNTFYKNNLINDYIQYDSDGRAIFIKHTTSPKILRVINNILYKNEVQSADNGTTRDLHYDNTLGYIDPSTKIINNILQFPQSQYAMFYIPATLNINDNYFVQNPQLLNENNIYGNDSVIFTMDDGANLATNSFSINKGIVNAFTPNDDILGVSRPQNSNNDIGAYEYTSLNNLNNLEIIDTQEDVIYPNPFTDFLFVEFKEDLNKKIEIFDISGKKIKTITASDKLYKINTTNLINGTYILKIITPKHIWTKKIIKK